MAASRIALRVLLAALFILSAVAKLVAIDDFELYVFSFGFMPLTLTYIATRICIVAEFLLGVLIAIGWWRKWVNLAAMAMLLLFSIFLCYAALIGRTDSCQCMGRLADMSPAVSLLKNAVLMVLVLLYMRLVNNGEDRGRLTNRKKVLITAGLVAAVLVAVSPYRCQTAGCLATKICSMTRLCCTRPSMNVNFLKDTN